MVPDKTLQHDVLAEFEPSVNAAHIGVAAKDGVITLTVRLGSFEQKLAAERAARRIRGSRRSRRRSKRGFRQITNPR